MTKPALPLALLIAAMQSILWSAAVTSSQVSHNSRSTAYGQPQPDPDPLDAALLDGFAAEDRDSDGDPGEPGEPCVTGVLGHSGDKMHKKAACQPGSSGTGSGPGRRRRPSQTARRYQPLSRPNAEPLPVHRALLLFGAAGGGGGGGPHGLLQRDRLRRCATTETVEGTARLRQALPRDPQHDAVVLVHAAYDWAADNAVLDIIADRMANVTVFAPPHPPGPGHGHGQHGQHRALGPLLRRCHALGARCTRLDSLLPVLAWLSEEAAEKALAREREAAAMDAVGGHGPGAGAATLPLELYDSRWLAAAPESAAAAMGMDLADAVLPEPPGPEAPDPIGPPAADGEVQSHEVAVHRGQRLQMSVHKQLEQLVSRLCDRDRGRNHFFELHNPPITEEDLMPTMAPETALSLRDILPINPKHYDKNRAPKLAGQPTIVYFHVTVLSLDSINEESMTYVADIFLAQSWRDPRLRLPENMSEEYRILDVEWLHDIWRPDCFFKNAKKVTFHEMSIPNHYLWLYHDKTLLYMSKLTLVLSCAMKFESYPHDTQICSMSIESLSHTVHDLVFIWNMTDPLVVNPEIELPQLDISNNYTADCTIEYSTGNFTCLAVVFNLRRRLGYHLFHSYIPSALIVIMSWISFWIKPEAIPARVTLGVTSLLTLATQNTQSQQSLPPVSYVKAIDVWMSSCSVFVFLSLMEFAVVNNYMGPVATKVMKGYSEEDIQAAVEDMKELEPGGRSPLRAQSVPTVPQYDTCCNGRETALYIDKFSRFFFPFSFFILNVVYWSTFL